MSLTEELAKALGENFKLRQKIVGLEASLKIGHDMYVTLLNEYTEALSKEFEPKKIRLDVYLTMNDKDDLLKDIERQGWLVIDWWVDSRDRDNLARDNASDLCWHIAVMPDEPWIRQFIQDITER